MTEILILHGNLPIEYLDASETASEESVVLDLLDRGGITAQQLARARAAPAGANLTELKVQLTDLQRSIPASPSLDELLVDLRALAASTGTTISHFDAGDAVAYTPPAAPASTAPSSGGAASPSPTPTPTPTAATPAKPESPKTTTNSLITQSNFVAIPVTIGVDGTTDIAVAFFGALQRVTRLVLVTEFSGNEGKGSPGAAGSSGASAITYTGQRTRLRSRRSSASRLHARVDARQVTGTTSLDLPRSIATVAPRRGAHRGGARSASMSDTTPESADKRADAGRDAPDLEPAAASAAAHPAPAGQPPESAANGSAEPRDTDPDMAAPPSGPVAARGHVNRPADERAPVTPVTPSPAAPAPAIEPEPVTASDDDIAAAVARTNGESGPTAAGDATVDTASPAQSAAPVIIAGEAARQQIAGQQAAGPTPDAQTPAVATAAYAAQPGEATWAPEPAAAPPIAPQPVAPIFLQRPEPPTRKSNRGVGILIALVGTVLFAVLWAVAVVVVGAMLTPSSDFIPSLIQFFTSRLAGWAPIVAFFVGLVVLIQIINRARWWAYILGGLFVAIFVYLVYIGAVLLDNQFFQRNAGEQQLLLRQAWVAPFAVLAGVIAREVSIWTGAWLAARGRKLKARNAEAQADYEQQVADAQNQAANAYAQQGY
ncbi:hypothetical protein ACPPVW_03545 [Leifsonia sp. McL0607]|uniref:hypothetical protein n=1 Tax=Leifsonia sp. McL0607 TaxID=3415672 RepID=UPI003CE92C11